ncbi:aldo/keto reductase [Aurantibacter crassamenti]|uniref:aldo/keto reductase n=1 Tax=Aurantibacter crassamenti TaxID=1837375 RepID=UPI00193AADD0|nr:aldo/keto reductase [Aurantibacter crassamenti]MBM1105367.1 aldo/keto reductase [Aurantibacter crassamenti]
MNFSRREIIQLYGLAGLGLIAAPTLLSFSPQEKMQQRSIPSSGEKIPMVGLGTWLTFDIGNSIDELEIRKLVLAEMYNLGGTVIDSSPMYGSSETVVGKTSSQLDSQNQLFYATKVWTSGKQSGIDQMNSSMRKMQRQKMDLMQIHNLVDWKTHVNTLRAWKDEGKIRYWGLTHYVDSAHPTLERIIKSDKPDFVQFNYSINSRNAEKSLFDTCKKNGTAVIINQPYDSGNLFSKIKGKPLPSWASEYAISSWGQYFLKFILSNEDVTCVIPGTSNLKHLIDNMGAGYGALPNNSAREKMANYLKNL